MDFKNPVRVNWHEQYVLTTAQLAEYFDCSVNNIYENFRRCHDRFVEGIHYFKLAGDNLKAFRDYLKKIEVVSLIPRRTPHFYLWTEAGVFQHVKMLQTDKAWEIYGDLVLFYFRYRDVVAQDTQLVSVQTAQPDDTQAILRDIQATMLEILDTVNSTADAQQILRELRDAFQQTAQIRKQNRDIECGKILGKMIFALKNSETKERIVKFTTNLLAGEKVF